MFLKAAASKNSFFRGEILRPPGGSVPQAIVARYKEIKEMVLFISKEELDKNKTVSPTFRTHYTVYPIST
jgi:hypothetical protein